MFLYDDVFRTLLNDCTSLMLPVISHVFGEQYSGDEEIFFSPNEHFLNRQGGTEDEQITDSSFKIQGKATKRYHLECQSSPDSSMLLRFFEYRTQIALDEGLVRGNTLTITLPHSAVLYLRCRPSTPDTLRIRIETPGGSLEYEIPALKSQRFSLQKIFDKNLLFLLPFYIFSHEDRFKKYEKDAARLKELHEEYADIRNRLDELAEIARISEYVKCTIEDMSEKVLEHIAARHNAVRKGVSAVLDGKVLEYEAKTFKREGMAEGREKGIRDTVSILKNLDIPQQVILDKIQEQYRLSSEASKKILVK